MSKHTFTGTLYVTTCCQCGIAFGMPDDFDDRRRADHGTFYCPSGHAQSYKGETEEERLRRQLERAQRRAASAEGAASRAEYRRRAAVGQVTKIKRRVSKGVCPCCNRTFKDLAAHMETKHPDYVEVPA